MTTRIAAIIGRPGTGKSSVVRAVMERAASDWRQVTPVDKETIVRELLQFVCPSL